MLVRHDGRSTERIHFRDKLTKLLLHTLLHQAFHLLHRHPEAFSELPQRPLDLVHPHFVLAHVLYFCCEFGVVVGLLELVLPLTLRHFV